MTQTERQWQPVRLGGDIPAPVGAYSPAVRAGGFVYVSGQIPRDFKTGAMVGDDVEGQTRQCISNIQAILGAAGASLSDIVSMTVYLSSISLWDRFNTVYKELMPTPYPTRTAVGAELHGCHVEITAVAFVGTSR